MRKDIFVLLAALMATPCPAVAATNCKVGKILELKVTMQGTRPMADVGINGRSFPFIVDSGAFYSTITPGTAAELGLRLETSPVQLAGIGGEAGATYLTHVKSLDLAGMSLHDIQFIVGGGETGSGGLLGQNVLGLGDVEYDLEHGAIRVLRSLGCSSDDNLAYWAGSQPVSDLPIERRDSTQRHTIGTILINGAKIRAVFDTGAESSILSISAAKRAGLTISTPGAVPAGVTRGLGRSMVRTWLVPVQDVTIGTEQVHRIKLRIGEIDLNGADMLVGADFFLSHRVYVANGLHRIFFTYDGGPVFNATPGRVIDQSGAAQTIAAQQSPEPTDAASFSRRGAAETSRRDYKAGIADLDRAVAMDPSNGKYLLQRGRAHVLAGNLPAAFADLDQAARVAPDDTEIRLAHAESLMVRRRPAEALAELEVADGKLPREADERLALAGTFTRLDQWQRAIANYDEWIRVHPDDSRQAVALNGRCWTRALAGTDLPLALRDCDAALRRVKSAAYYDSRGLVELRMGAFDRAIADYNAALELSPKDAWSLYGRGLARRHKNDPSAQSDLNAAIAINPAVAARAKTLGIS